MMDYPDDTDAALSLFEAYAAGLDDYDAQAIIACFAFPATIWQFGKGYVFEDAEELRENIDKLLDAFEEAGIVRSVFEIEDESPLSESFWTLRWEQEVADGEVVHAFSCHYFLVEAEDGTLKIASIANIAEA